MGSFISAFSRKEESAELVPLKQRVDVVVCSGSLSNSVEGLTHHIKQYINDVVRTVRFETLPYNISDMNRFDLTGIDVLLLCHSIHNRRFSITDVTDSLYDGFLQRARKTLGKSKVGVIAYDFPEADLSPEILPSKMASFRYNQPTTFECASLALIGGKLDEGDVQLTEDQLEELQQFFINSSSPPIEEKLTVTMRSSFHLITCNVFN
ncbi:uncharacterized protein LOC121405597 [Lytechinus variegatus]|uniref:uncharacterized protein LOC121405597 n=1 Tax=Lytechinus variegatus TaxID=7654 RepID=UPI001BB21266|nr:uncharacterized protein LOC121405597 [Lytechinus variegatus]